MFFLVQWHQLLVDKVASGRSQGLVLVSFGSVVGGGSSHQMPEEMARGYAHAFAHLPHLDFVVRAFASPTVHTALFTGRENVHPITGFFNQRWLLGELFLF
jgi:hypothetical protein